MFKKILLANDGSAGAFRALALAFELAKTHKAELHTVSVEEIQWMPGSREEVIGEKELENHRFDDAIKRAKQEADKQHVKITTHLLIGHPVKAISEFVRANGFDNLVIGYVGHSQLYDMMMGGTAERLVRLAPCTVIVAK
ncbi:MAG TPA: universal stress protein [Rhodospirillales bacterium]